MKRIAIIFVLVISMVIFTVPAAALDAGEYAPISAPQPYGDVAGTWFEKAAITYGYTDIFSDGSGYFYPHKKITRMEFARMLHRALGVNINYFAAPDIKQYFGDVENGDVGVSELCDLVTAGIIDDRGSFKPDGELSREDMIHYTLNALNYMTGGNYAIILIMPQPFADDDQIDEAYKPEVYRAVVLRLIKGYGDGTLQPKQGASRAEAVTVAGRLVDLLDSFKAGVDVSAAVQKQDNGLKMTLAIVNNSDKTVTIEHTSSQRYDFKLFDEKGEVLYTWSSERAFLDVLTTTEIKAKDRVEYTETLKGSAYEAIKDRIATVKAYITGTSQDFVVNPEGYYA